MTPHRPIAHAEILDILQKVLGAAPQDLTLVKGSRRNPIFTFSVDGAKRLLRFRPRPANFFRDVHAWRRFKSATLPIPEVFFVGEFDAEVRFCISELLPGGPLSLLGPQEVPGYRDALLSIAREIHEHVAPTGGAGSWDTRGQGTSPSWRQYLQKLADGITWGNLAQDGEEARVFHRLMAIHRSLIDACPNLHSLVHGDFGLNNILAVDGQITGVVDWQHSLYGDFLFDLARLDLWQPHVEILKGLELHYKPETWPLDQAEDRIRCYQTRLAARALKSVTVRDFPQRRKAILERVGAWL